MEHNMWYRLLSQAAGQAHSIKVGVYFAHSGRVCSILDLASRGSLLLFEFSYSGFHSIYGFTLLHIEIQSELAYCCHLPFPFQL